MIREEVVVQLALLAFFVFGLGVIAGLIGLVSRTIRGYRAPVAGAIATICGVVAVIPLVGITIETGEFPLSGWSLLPVVLIVIGLCMAFLGRRPPDRQPLPPLPRMCGATTPQGRPCALPPGHEGSHRYVAPQVTGPSPRGPATASSSS